MSLRKIFPRSSPLGAALKMFAVGTGSIVLFLLLALQADAGERRIQAMASIFPAFDFARIVGGDRLEIQQLLPPGVEAHGFAPTPRDIIRINQADLFFFTGATMEPRVAKMLRSLDGDVQVVDLSVPFAEPDRKERDKHQHDPHFWLDPIKAQVMVEEVADALIQLDPKHAKGYRARANAYITQLKKLDGDIRQGLTHCTRHTLISGGHFAFGHFISRYHLQAVSAYPGFSPDGKPSPRGIATLLKTMASTGATAVFYEELMEPKVARIIVEETGAQLLLLHAAHNVSKQEMAEGVSYISIMEGNLARLRQGLSCQ